MTGVPLGTRKNPSPRWVWMLWPLSYWRLYGEQGLTWAASRSHRVDIWLCGCVKSSGQSPWLYTLLQNLTNTFFPFCPRCFNSLSEIRSSSTAFPFFFSLFCMTAFSTSAFHPSLDSRGNNIFSGSLLCIRVFYMFYQPFYQHGVC